MQYRFKTKEVVLQRNQDGSLLIREKPASDEGYKNVVVELLSRKPKCKALYPDISEFFAGGKDPIRRLFKRRSFWIRMSSEKLLARTVLIAPIY